MIYFWQFGSVCVYLLTVLYIFILLLGLVFFLLPIRQSRSVFYCAASGVTVTDKYLSGNRKHAVASVFV